ncbi:DUF292-domain-containing protein [Ramaria rubella]|nr:DUF292-domain-containing protein [Ramaria rubella]
MVNVLWNAARTKVQLRLAVQRLRMLQQKKEAQAKSSRRDIATLIERGKLETARVKVENIINEDIHVELLELLELYCELLISRFGLLEISSKEPDPGVYEGICCIIHAAPRTELKELHVLREMLMHKFGREFSLAVMENRDGCVNERVMKKLILTTPPPALVDAYLGEIAKGYGIEWTPSTGNGDNHKDGDESNDLKDTVPKAVNESDLETGPSTTASTASPEVTLTLDEKATVSKLPDMPPPEGQPPAYKPPVKPLKSALKRTGGSTQGADSPPTQAQPPPPSEDDFLTLTKRFEALKKR